MLVVHIYMANIQVYLSHTAVQELVPNTQDMAGANHTGMANLNLFLL
jgi:hypothetical protein